MSSVPPMILEHGHQFDKKSNKKTNEIKRKRYKFVNVFPMRYGALFYVLKLNYIVEKHRRPSETRRSEQKRKEANRSEKKPYEKHAVNGAFTTSIYEASI